MQKADKVTRVATWYSMTFNVEIMQKIFDRDHEPPYLFEREPLYKLLERIPGIDNVDYDGHFGPHISFRLEYEYDYRATWETIEEYINRFLEAKV